MNKILITGALGHIGSALIRNLGKTKAKKIIMLDNLATQRYPSLFNLPKKYSYEFLEADVRSCNFGKILPGVDVVIHLAALTNAQESIKKAKEVEAVNFHGLKRVADACLDQNIRLIFPSTTSVYGSQASVVDETCLKLKPQSPYANTKLLAEQYLASLKSKGLRYVVCRFGTIFGYSVGMRFHTAVNKFLWQAATKQPLTVWKTAWKQRRPYLDLEDCVRAINFILMRDLFNNEIYNVLTKNYTVEEIVSSIKEFIPNLTVSYVDSPIMNQLSYDVANDKFKSMGFKVKGDLKKSLTKNISKLWKSI